MSIFFCFFCISFVYINMQQGEDDIFFFSYLWSYIFLLSIMTYMQTFKCKVCALSFFWQTVMPLLLISLHTVKCKSLALKAPIKSSTHPFISTYPGPGRRSAEKHRSLTPRPPPLAFLGNYQGVPKPAESYNRFSVSWVCVRASTRWDMPRTPHAEDAQEAS